MQLVRDDCQIQIMHVSINFPHKLWSSYEYHIHYQGKDPLSQYTVCIGLSRNYVDN